MTHIHLFLCDPFLNILPLEGHFKNTNSLPSTQLITEPWKDSYNCIECKIITRVEKQRAKKRITIWNTLRISSSKEEIEMPNKQTFHLHKFLAPYILLHNYWKLFKHPTPTFRNIILLGTVGNYESHSQE
jgi:hypothetical protein